MKPIINVVGRFGLVLLLLVSGSQDIAADEICEGFNKQVSVDGGITWFDADDPSSAPSQVIGEGAIYRFIVKNCETNKTCSDTRITDPDLEIFDVLVPGINGGVPGFLAPGDEIIVTKDDGGFENLDQPDRCDTPGTKKNTATETTTVSGPNPVTETFMDEANVNCEEIIIEKFTNGHDGDDANGIPDPGTGDFTIGAPSVAEIPADGAITWTYDVTNKGPDTLVNVAVTDSQGVFVDCFGQNTIAPGQTITCEATGSAEDLATTGGDVDGCDAFGTGETRPTYENLGVVVGTVENTDLVLTAEDPSHYCNPPPPDIIIEKFTNGYDADDANGFPVPTPPNGGLVVGGVQVPLVAIGAPVNWTYVVTNTGPDTLVDVVVTDTEGVDVTCPLTTLDPSESMTCMAMGTALDLSTDPFATIVDGCGAQGQGMTQPTYENFGQVVARGQTSGIEVEDEDPSHYCNPPMVMIEKFTNGHDGDNANGPPAAGSGSFDAGGVTVAEVPSGNPITWTYRVTNNGTEALEDVVVNDSQGVQVSCPQTTLAPGQTINCTATGSADDLLLSGGDVDGCGAFGAGETRPTYENLGSVEARGTTSGVLVEDDDPSHYCNPELPPECGLTVDKTCAVPPPPIGADAQCDGRLTQFTMTWDGPSGIQVSGPANDAAGTVLNGDVVTFFGPFADNDVIVDISGAVSGQSTFHTSCSDKDMDGATDTNDQQQQVSSLGRDCGKFEGNGKGDNGNINQWLLEGFVDNSGDTLVCTPTPTGGATSCELQSVVADCKSPTDKPDAFTWLYSGGGCGASDNGQNQSGDLFCTGSVNGNLPVTIVDDKDNVFNVAPGGTFNTSRDASKVFTLTNVGGTEESGRHVSCSQPLQAGDVYGSLTLAALNGAGIGSDIVYEYVVSNLGVEAVNNISVDDDQLGFIGSIGSLAPGDSEILSATAFISATTTNVASVDGDGPPGSVCEADSNPVVVTVLPPPLCSVSLSLKELKDDAIKYDLTNVGPITATLESQLLNFPSGFDAIKEVKLGGSTIFKSGDSSVFPSGVPSGATIEANDWTEDNAEKRQLEGDATETLEIKFNENWEAAGPDDFSGQLVFGGNCSAAAIPVPEPLLAHGLLGGALLLIGCMGRRGRRR